MTVMVRRLGLALAVLLIATSGASGCGSPDADATRLGSGGTPVATTLDCAALIPDAAIAALGWSPSAPAEEHVDRCERRVDGKGAVTVGTRALTGLSASPST